MSKPPRDSGRIPGVHLVRAVILMAQALLAGPLMPGCGGASKALRDGAPVFLPPLPNRPRLQFLASYSGSEDIETRSRFEEFVVGKDEAKGNLVKPYGAVMLDDRLIVTDVGARDIVVFDFKNRKYRPLKGNTGGGRAREPLNLGAGPDGSIYVADGGRNQVLVYGPDESFVASWGVEGQFRPTDVQVHGDEVFVVNVRDHDIHVLDRRSGRLLRKIAGPGREPGKLYYPTNLAIGPDGDLYVTEIGNFRVQRLQPDGTSVRAFGKLGDTPGSLARPKGVAVDPEGRVYVADAAFENVQIFDERGRLLLFFGGPGADPGNLYLPAGLEITTSGLDRFRPMADKRLDLRYIVLVVSQYGNRKVSVFGYGDWKGPEGGQETVDEPVGGEPPLSGRPPDGGTAGGTAPGAAPAKTESPPANAD